MEDLFFVNPGQSFDLDGSHIFTPEGVMSGQVSLRVADITPPSWPCEIIGVSKPEWEWMLGRVVFFPAKFVREQIKNQI